MNHRIQIYRNATRSIKMCLPFLVVHISIETQCACKIVSKIINSLINKYFLTFFHASLTASSVVGNVNLNRNMLTVRIIGRFVQKKYKTSSNKKKF